MQTAQAVQTDVPTLEAAFQGVFDAADYYGAEEPKITKTVFHLARKARDLKPTAQYKDLVPYIERFCNKHEADTDKHLEELCYILIQGLSLAAPIIQTQERLEANSWRETKLPDTIAQTPGYKTLATACRYLGEISEGGTFFLGARKAGELIGESKSSAAKKLLVLQSAGVIHLEKEAYSEWVTNEETGDRTFVRRAAEYVFTLDDNSQQWTQDYQGSQGTQVPQGNHHPQEPIDMGLVSGTDWDEELHDTPEPDTPEEHDHAMDAILKEPESSSMVVVKAALFEEQEPVSMPLGKPDELIAMSVEPKPCGVLGIMPKQSTLPEPTATTTALVKEKSKTTTDPDGMPKSLAQALESFVQTAEAMEAKRQTAPPQEERSDDCYKCNKPTTYQAPIGSDYNAVLCESCRGKTETSQLSKAERCKKELCENHKGNASTGDKTNQAARIIAKFLGKEDTRSIKYILTLREQYGAESVVSMTYEILDDPSYGRMDNPIGVLGSRLKKEHQAVAV